MYRNKLITPFVRFYPIKSYEFEYISYKQELRRLKPLTNKYAYNYRNKSRSPFVPFYTTKSYDEFTHMSYDDDIRMLKPLTSKYVYNYKNKPIHISFDILDITQNIMVDRLKDNLAIGN